MVSVERRAWDELDGGEKALYDWVDLEDGETMADWWEVYQDALEEDGEI